MNKAIRWVLVIALLGAVAGGGWWFWNQWQSSTATEIEVLRTAETVRDSLEISVAASGTAALERSVELSFDLPGTVHAVHVEVGDRVAAGEELARLDDETLRDTVARAELDLTQAKLNLETAQEPVDEADIETAKLTIREAGQAMQVAKLSEQYAQVRANVDQTRAHEIEADVREAYESYLDILDDFGLPPAYAAGITATYMEAQGNVGITQLRSDYTRQQAQSQWQTAYQRYQQAQRDLTQLQEGPEQSQIRRLKLQVEQQEIALEQARADLESAGLTAPFSGIVAAVNLQENTATPLTRPAVVLLDDANTYIDLSIDEIDISSIEPGQTVHLTLDAYPDLEVLGIVEQIAALPETGSGIVIYPVRTRITESNGAEIREGMTASAQVRIGQKDDIVLIPNWAIRTDQTSERIFTYCYCVEDGMPQQVFIETGLRNDTWTEVISGLEPGATVALVSESQNILQFAGPPSQGLD